MTAFILFEKKAALSIYYVSIYKKFSCLLLLGSLLESVLYNSNFSLAFLKFWLAKSPTRSSSTGRSDSILKIKDNQSF